jgi:hypothetical protein
MRNSQIHFRFGFPFDFPFGFAQGFGSPGLRLDRFGRRGLLQCRVPPFRGRRLPLN